MSAKRVVANNQSDRGASQPLVMTDWAANVESICSDCRTLLWELVLHSFLRDNILIQDEALAQSAKFARWFCDDRQFQILEELIDAGLFVVITQEPGTYPDLDLQDLAYASPISARAEYILRHGAKHGKAFRLPSYQRKFHKKLDAALHRRGATRPRKKTAGKDIHQLFQSFLLQVLTDERCKKWLKSAFGIGPRLQGELTVLIGSPEKAVERISADPGKRIKLDPRSSSDPRFTRNLGHHLAATYDPPFEHGINNLVHSAYAAAFCKIEGNAAGRYSAALRELLLPDGRALASSKRQELPVVRVITEMKSETLLKLPAITPGFMKVVMDVRGTEAGKNLRTSLQALGSQRRFDVQERNWAAVANELASRVAGGGKRIVLRRVAAEIRGGATKATLGDLIYETFRHPPSTRQEFGERAVKAFGIHLFGHTILGVGRCCLEMMRASIRQDKWRRQIERSVAFRCTDI